MNRILTQASLFLASTLSCVVALWLEPGVSPNVVLADGLGYFALLLLVATLLIGPLNLARKRRNPVNLNLRRDVGIWCGITSLLHVFFAFQIYEKGNIFGYFVQQDQPGLALQTNLFGLSNVVGLAATLIMLMLLMLSNDLSLKFLKGKRWKFLQRFNYPLFALTIAHTVGYQLFNERDSWLFLSVAFLVVLTVSAQIIGVTVMQQRQQARAVATATAAKPIAQPQPAANVISMPRRNFLIVTGATILTSFVGGLAVRPLLFKDQQPELKLVSGQASLPTSTGSSAATATPAPTSTPAPAIGGNPNTGGRPRFGNNAPATATPAPTATPTPAQSGSATSSANGGSTAATGPVLATLVSLPVGSVKQFTTPDSKENAFLVREADGSVKALSGICTHRPYDLVYDGNNQDLYCELHGASFSVQDGSVIRRPARTALSSLNVKVDGQGNIVYQAG